MANIEILKKRYVALNGVRPISPSVMEKIKSELGLSLPPDFLKICDFFDGSGINVISLHSMKGNAPTQNPVHETLRLRASIGLPPNWLVLGEPPESLILMDCNSGGRTIWIDAIDAKRILSQAFIRPPDSWNTFAEFFEYLLNEEEADR